MADQDNFNQIIAGLRGASYLVSAQALELTMRSVVGVQLVRWTGRAADHESLYASLLDLPAEGVYVCWIFRENRRFLRALEQFAVIFKHRPYQYLETHFTQNTQIAPSPLSIPIGPFQSVPTCGGKP